MANVKISQLPAATTPLTGVEQVPLVQNGVTTRTSVNNLKGPDGVRYFQTYATMTALTTANGRVDNMVVEVASRTTEGDGGGGTWRYDAGSSATVNGGTVLAADDAVGRWLRVYSGPLNVKWFGAKGDNTTDDTTAAQAAITAATNGALYFPTGTYRAGTLAGVSNPEWFGDGAGASIIKAINSLTSDLIGFLSKTNISIHDLTIDYNTSAAVGTPSALGFLDCDDVRVHDCQIINFVKLGLGFNSCNRVWVQNNYIAKTTASPTAVNECILVTESGFGTSSYFWIDNNYCVNSGMLLQGAYMSVTNNSVINWQYGAGVGIAQTTTTIFAYVAGNYFSNGYNGLDGDGFTCKGIECWGSASRIEGNVCFNNGGPGMYVGGQRSIVADNICYNNVIYTAEVGAGIVLGYLDATYNASRCVVTGNTCFDTLGAGGTQDYGISVNASNVGIVLAGNAIAGNRVADTDASSTQTFYGFNSVATVTWDPGSIAVGASTTQTITVSGAAFGDFVAVSCSISLAGLTLTGYVSGVNSVVLVLANLTAGAVDLSSATFRAIVTRPLF